MLRVFFILLVLFSLCHCLAPAACADPAASGTCGDSITWTLDDQGTLIISGTGEIDRPAPGTDYYQFPWGDYANSIKTAVINEGITGINENAFLKR